ncbi:MAG TPA: ABC transporter ATP-binding protein [Alphaproteobacteria bacterium]|nr:ABC transporter ATP-binding protein [Alphaproteobacteria bacterium]
MVAALTVRDLAWGVRQGVPILCDINFDVAPQEMICIIGPSGAGKTSLLRCLARANRPWRGVIQLNGADLWGLAPGEAARRIAAVPQEAPAAYPFRVRDVLMLGRSARRRGRGDRGAQDRAKIGAALEQLHLAHLAERLFSTLSGGEKQRVLIARALAQEASLVLLDEPTHHVDIGLQLEILDLLRRLGRTVVVASHDLNLVASFADRVLLLDGGRLIGAGPAAEILTIGSIRAAFAVEALIDRHPWVPAPRFAFHPIGKA